MILVLLGVALGISSIPIALVLAYFGRAARAPRTRRRAGRASLVVSLVGFATTLPLWVVYVRGRDTRGQPVDRWGDPEPLALFGGQIVAVGAGAWAASARSERGPF